MESDLKRRLVSIPQLQMLLQLMKEHPDLARGLSRGRLGKLMTVKVWNNCAQKLNSIQDGAIKDGKGWSKYWCDWKYRVRRHALEIRVTTEGNQPLPVGLNPLTPVEKTILNIIGVGAVEGVVIKTDPLGDEDSNDEEQAADDQETNETRSEGVKRRLSTNDAADDDGNEEDSDAPPEQRARFENDDDDEKDGNNDNNEDEVVEMDNTSQFLFLEKMQLENSRRIQKSICRISLEICKLTDIMAEIRDVLVKRLDTVT